MGQMHLWVDSDLVFFFTLYCVEFDACNILCLCIYSACIYLTVNKVKIVKMAKRYKTGVPTSTVRYRLYLINYTVILGTPEAKQNGHQSNCRNFIRFAEYVFMAP